MAFPSNFTSAQATRFFLLLLLVGLATVARSAGGPTQPATSAATAMSYSDLIKRIGAANGNDGRLASSLAGQNIQLTLKASGPQALVVNASDGVFFTCKLRDASFKSGKVTTRIAKYGTTPDGDVSIQLENCGH